jgi:hypothetical protein
MIGSTWPTTIHNARVQLTATAISNVGVGFIIVGVLTPFLHGELSLAIAFRAILAAASGGGSTYSRAAF